MTFSGQAQVIEDDDIRDASAHSLLGLPNELSLHILSFLPIKTLLVTSGLSRKLNELTSEPLCRDFFLTRRGAETFPLRMESPGSDTLTEVSRKISRTQRDGHIAYLKNPVGRWVNEKTSRWRTCCPAVSLRDENLPEPTSEGEDDEAPAQGSSIASGLTLELLEQRRRERRKRDMRNVRTLRVQQLPSLEASCSLRCMADVKDFEGVKTVVLSYPFFSQIADWDDKYRPVGADGERRAVHPFVEFLSQLQPESACFAEIPMSQRKVPGEDKALYVAERMRPEVLDEAIKQRHGEDRFKHLWLMGDLFDRSKAFVRSSSQTMEPLSQSWHSLREYTAHCEGVETSIVMAKGRITVRFTTDESLNDDDKVTYRERAISLLSAMQRPTGSYTTRWELFDAHRNVRSVHLDGGVVVSGPVLAAWVEASMRHKNHGDWRVEAANASIPDGVECVFLSSSESEPCASCGTYDGMTAVKHALAADR